MKTLIIYSTKYGTTQRYANMMKEHASSDVICLNVEDVSADTLHPYETIVLGSSIYIGSIRKDMKKFCEEFEDILLNKQLYLFINGMRSGDELAEELATAYPEKLRQHALNQIALGGHVTVNKLKFMDKKIMQMASKEDPGLPTFDPTTDFSLLDEKSLIAFSHSL